MKIARFFYFYLLSPTFQLSNEKMVFVHYRIRMITGVKLKQTMIRLSYNVEIVSSPYILSNTFIG